MVPGNIRPATRRAPDGATTASPRPDGTHCPPEFERVKADAREIVTKPHSWARIGENWLYALATPRVVLILTALVLVQLALLVVLNRGVLFGERNAIAVKSSALDLNDFHPLSIREFQSNTRPHIAIEGYVRDVHVDKEEGTLHFRLVEIPHRSVPFVVCEIISPIGMTLPREGSRVRVYGVARYDAQPDRLWHEVNPVLDIALLKR